MSPIERAARALCLIDEVDPDSSLGGDGHNLLWMEYANVNVKAVLQAIREPSDEMNAAGIDADDHIEFNNHGRIWQAMIDAALKDV